MNKYISLLILLTCLISHEVYGQLSPEQKAHISEVLQPVSDPHKPGVSVALLKDGEIIYTKANGMANMETKTHTNERTLYQVDALAKQFTTLAFIKLINQNLISLDDDIREYIPQLPIYEEAILVKHVLNHTTGLSNYEVIQELTGVPSSRGFNNEDALALISSQKELSYKPGSHFSIFDSKTESLLMAEIIAKVSGSSFSEFVQDNVLSELELNETVILENSNKLISNMAFSYQDVDGELQRIHNNDNAVGASNLFISISDLAKWYSYFSPRQENHKYELIKQLDTPVTNDLGENFVSGWGEMTLGRSFLHLERDVPMYWQYGLKGGYGANIFRFPELDLTSIAIGNNNSYNGMYAMPIADSFTDDYFKRPATVEANSINTIELDPDNIEEWQGEYFNPLTGQLRQFEMQNDTLRYMRWNNAITLLPIENNSFQAVMQSDDILKFHFGSQGSQKYYDVTSFPGSDQRYYAIDSDYSLSTEELEEFTGIYLNTELGQMYNFAIQGDTLLASHNKNEDILFRSITNDLFTSDNYALSSIRFYRKQGVITHFTISTGGINNISFQKAHLVSSIPCALPCKAYQQ